MTDIEKIKFLGGPTKLAKRLAEHTGTAIDREAIYKWKAREFIPWKWRHHVEALLTDAA